MLARATPRHLVASSSLAIKHSLAKDEVPSERERERVSEGQEIGCAIVCYSFFCVVAGKFLLLALRACGLARKY